MAKEGREGGKKGKKKKVRLEGKYVFLHNEAHVHEATANHLGVAQDGEDVAEGDRALGGVAAQVCFQSRLDVGALVFAEPFGLFGAVEDHLVRNETQSPLLPREGGRGKKACLTYKVGKMKRKPMQTRNVMAPSIIKIHRQPLYPRRPFTC